MYEMYINTDYIQIKFITSPPQKGNSGTGAFKVGGLVVEQYGTIWHTKFPTGLSPRIQFLQRISHKCASKLDTVVPFMRLKWSWNEIFMNILLDGINDSL